MDDGQSAMVPYLARILSNADDRKSYVGYDYYNDDIIGIIHNGDVEVIPDKCNADPDTVHAEDEDPEYICFHSPSSLYLMSRCNHAIQDEGIIYEKHNKGVTMLHIWDVKRQYGSEDHVKYCWKLDEETKECQLEIDQSDKNEQGKQTVKFSLDTNDTDKLVSQVVDGYEVKYMLRTDAMRLRIELVIEASTPDTKPDFSNVHGEVNLQIEPDHKPYTLMLLGDQRPNKKPKMDHSDTSKHSIIRIIPRNLPAMLKLDVALKDSTGMLDVQNCQLVFPYNFPVDQYSYIPFENGYIRLYIFWGCCLNEQKGVCSWVCTCEPGDYIGFPSPAEVSCSTNDEEKVAYRKS